MKFNFNTAKKRVVSDALSFHELFESGNFDISLGELNGDHQFFINKVSDRIYYFVEGQAYAEVGDDVHDCRAGDVILIPRNTKYGLAGKAKFIKITSPPFSPDSEKV